MGAGNVATMATARKHGKAVQEVIKAMRARYTDSAVDTVIIQHTPTEPTIRANTVVLHVEDKLAQWMVCSDACTTTTSVPESIDSGGHFIVTF